MDWQATRPGETEVPLPERTDARLVFIGRIRTPFATRDDCPRQGRQDGPICRVEIDELIGDFEIGELARGHEEEEQHAAHDFLGGTGTSCHARRGVAQNSADTLTNGKIVGP